MSGFDCKKGRQAGKLKKKERVEERTTEGIEKSFYDFYDRVAHEISVAVVDSAILGVM